MVILLLLKITFGSGSINKSFGNVRQKPPVGGFCFSRPAEVLYNNGSCLRPPLGKSRIGEVCEWLKQQVSKTCKPQGFEGSNPSLSVALYNIIPRHKAGFLLAFPSVFFYQSKSFFFKLYHFLSKITLPKTLPLTPQKAPQKRGLIHLIICRNSVPH